MPQKTIHFSSRAESLIWRISSTTGEELKLKLKWGAQSCAVGNVKRDVWNVKRDVCLDQLMWDTAFVYPDSSSESWHEDLQQQMPNQCSVLLQTLLHMHLHYVGQNSHLDGVQLNWRSNTSIHSGFSDKSFKWFDGCQIKLADIRVPKGLSSTSTKTNAQKEQLTAVMFSSALIPLKHSFCVNRTVSGTLWLYHPSHLPPSIWPVLPSPVPSLYTWSLWGFLQIMTFLYNLFYVKLGSTLLILLWFPAGTFWGQIWMDRF